MRNCTAKYAKSHPFIVQHAQSATPSPKAPQATPSSPFAISTLFFRLARSCDINFPPTPLDLRSHLA